MSTISKSAQDRSICKKDICFTQSAREAWKLILNTFNNDSCVLLPSYVGVTDSEGSGIYDPIIETKRNHFFYHLNEDLSINSQDLISKVKRHKPKAVLIVHYFGFIIPHYEEIVRILKSEKIVVVEDCAHLYNYNNYNYSLAGTKGDFVFYSLHKFFPLDCGGLLVCNNKGSDCFNYKRKGKDDYPREIHAFEIEKIITKRKQNFKLYNELLKNVSGVTILKHSCDQSIPHNFPIIVENGLREKLYFWLIEHDVTLIALYYRLIEPLSSPEYAEMNYLSSSILNLPVHQDTDQSQVAYVVKMIKKGIEELSK